MICPKALHALLALVACFGAGGWMSLRWQDPAPQAQSVVGQLDEKPGEFPPKEDLVKDWAKPDFVLLISGQLTGYIEPCGCTGLSNQKGGMQRRFQVLQLLRDRGWKVLPVDAGQQIHPGRRGQQTIMKLQTTYEAMCRLMGYEAISLGPSDLLISGTDLGQAMVDKLDASTGRNPFVSANVVVLDPSLVSPVQTIDAGNGKTVAVTSVISSTLMADLKDSAITTTPPEDALRKLTPQLQGTNASLKLLIVYGPRDEAEQLARQFPFFDYVVSAGNDGDPDKLPAPIVAGQRTTQLIQVGAKGMHVGLIGFWGNQTGEQRSVYERVPLDARFEVIREGTPRLSDLNPMELLFHKYQEELKNLYLNRANFQDIMPRNTPSGYKFVGSDACLDCHEEEYNVWRHGVDKEEGDGGPHFRATRDLTDPGERTWVARNFDPECLSCHVTGWNPQEYYPYKTGYLDLERDIKLHANGCENCHGPCSQHVAAEAGDIEADEAALARFREEVRLTLNEARNGQCMTCHDLDNSPDFFEEGAFEKYWAKIEHGPNAGGGAATDSGAAEVPSVDERR